MSGFAGFVNFTENNSNKKNIIEEMNSTLSKKGIYEDGFYINDNVALTHKRLIARNPNER